MNKLTPLAFGLTLAISGIANAESFRQHDAHVHGQVEFNIAQDGNELLVEITAPGADVVGFEHAPKTDEQKHKIEDVVTQLKQPSTLFTLASSAGCQIEHKSVTHTLGEDSHEEHDHHDHDKHEHHDDHAEHDHHDDHAEHDHDKHEHHDDHAEHDHDQHEHHDDHADHDKHGHHDEHEGGHGEFTIEYHYDCSDISKLNVIETQWFQHFPSTESIRANILTDTKQAALDLRQGQTKIEL